MQQKGTQQPANSQQPTAAATGTAIPEKDKKSCWGWPPGRVLGRQNPSLRTPFAPEGFLPTSGVHKAQLGQIRPRPVQDHNSPKTTQNHKKRYPTTAQPALLGSGALVHERDPLRQRVGCLCRVRFSPVIGVCWPSLGPVCVTQFETKKTAVSRARRTKTHSKGAVSPC